MFVMSAPIFLLNLTMVPSMSSAIAVMFALDFINSPEAISSNLPNLEPIEYKNAFVLSSASKKNLFVLVRASAILLN